MPRPTRVEVDLDAIAHNVRHLRRLADPATICAVVKADAYGHGDVPVAEAAVAAGAEMLAVALVEEGIRLREAGIEAPILLLCEPPVGDVAAVVEWGLTPTVQRPAFAEELAGTRLAVHLAVDTGMHRAGVDPTGVVGLAAAVADAGLTIAGTWTHLAVAESDEAFTRLQLDRFDQALGTLVDAGHDPGVRHAANSAGAMYHPEARLDMVRVGIAMYGLDPDPGRRDAELTPAMRVASGVSGRRRLAAGARPSYGRARPLASDGWVVTVPIGYADGYPRSLPPGFGVLIGESRHPLAGTVTMDQIVVDVGEADVAIGDEVVLLGVQGGAEVTANDWAEALDTISYEVVTRIGARVPREYRRG
jgi:alanine racemase